MAADYPSRQSNPIGSIAMLGSAFLFSIMALIVKLLSQFGTFELVFWRSFFMTIGTTTALIMRGKGLLGPAGRRGFLIWRGVAGFCFMSAFYYAVKTLPLSDAIAITYTSPVITGVAAAVLLGERWGLLDATGFFLAFVGVVLISKPSFVMNFFGVTTTPPPLDGSIVAVLSALLASSVYLLLRQAKDLDPVVSVNYFALVGMVLSLIAGFLNNESMVWPQGVAWIELALLAVLSVVGQALMNIGLARESAGRATAMNYLQVAFAYVYQTCILHQDADCLSIIGAIFIAAWGALAQMKEAMLRQADADFHAFPEQKIPEVDVGIVNFVTPTDKQYDIMKDASGPLLTTDA